MKRTLPFSPIHRKFAIACLSTLVICHSAHATTYTYSNTTNNTTPGTSWSAGINWDAVPVSTSTTSLVFNGTLAAGATIFSSNDISGNFQLNQMSFTHVGPGSDPVPKITVSGNALEFVNNAAVTPVLTFNTTGTKKPTVTISNNLILTNNLSVAVMTGGTLSGVISGAGNLTKFGTSNVALTLGNANTYTGKTTIQSGYLTVTSLNKVSSGSASSSLGAPTTEATGTIDIGEGSNEGRLIYNGTGETTDRVINLAGTTGSVRIDANNTTSALIFISNVTATGSGIKTLKLAGGAGGNPLNQIQGTIGDSTGGVTNVQKINAGNWALANTANTFTGSIVITEGVLAVSTLSDSGTASSIGKGAGAITISDSGGTSNKGTLRIIGAGGATNRNIITYNSATIDASGSGAAIFNGTLTGTNNGTGGSNPAALLILRGTSGSTITNKIAGDISGASMALTKTDANVWQLGGANTYGGATAVSQGTLILASTGSLAAGSAVTVQNSATLDVAGTINGTVTVDSGGTLKGNGGRFNASVTINGIHSPGASPGLQTFTTGMTYGATSTLNAELVGDSLGLRGTDFDGIDVTGGNLTIATAATFKLIGSSINYSAASWDVNRSFNIIDFSGAGNSTGVFTLDTSSAGLFAGQGTWGLANTDKDIVLSWVAVPESNVAAIIGSLGVIALLRRRRQSP